MGIFDQFPYSNFHEMNQDWLLQKMKQLAEAMAALELSWKDMKQWIKDYFNNLDIDDEIKAAILVQVDKMSKDGTLDALISRAIASDIPQYTSPVFVNSTNLMTDTDRIYVLTTDGSVYAYNGSEFYDTGYDYSFDGSGYVSQAGVLSNNTDVNTLTGVNTIYYLTSGYTYPNKPDGMTAGTLYIQHAGATTTQFALTTRGMQYMRYKIGQSAWVDWMPMIYGSGRTLLNGEDLNDITDPGVYIKTGSSSIVVDNIPEFSRQAYLAYVYVFVSGNSIAQTYITMGASDYAHIAATRYKSGSSWSDWKTIAWSSHGLLASGTDMNDVINSGWYFCNGQNDYIYSHMPEEVPTGAAAFLEVLTYQDLIIQRMVKFSDGIMCVRSSVNAGSTWRNWRAVAGKEVDPGSLTDAKYFAFGDSITMGSVWADGATTFADYDDRLPTRIGAACNIKNVINKGVSNIGYLAQSSGDRIIDIIQDTDLSDAMLVTLAGGRNDGNYSLGTSSATAGDGTICGAILACINYIKTQNKKCEIVVIQPTPNNQTDGSSAFTNTTTGGWSLDSFETQVKALCAKVGAAYVGWRDCSYVWSWASFTGDRGNYAHPNSGSCYAIMGSYLGGQVSKYCRM